MRYTYYTHAWTPNEQYMADHLSDADLFLPPDESPSSWGDQQFVHMWHPNNVPQELVPSFPGITLRNLSWWRAQTTRCGP